MKSATYIKVVLLVVFCVSIINAQNISKSGTTAGQFLKIDVGARAIGMGGAFTAISDDASSIYWNPAGLASINSSEAIFNHTDWIADVKYDFAGFTTYLDGVGTIGAFFNLMSMGDMLVRTEQNPEGTGENFTMQGISMGLSIARNLTDKFSIGFNIKYVQEDLWHMSSSGFALDAGVMYKIPILNEFRLAANISNFGTKMQLSGRDILIITQQGPGGGNLINTHIEMDEFDLPLLFRVGVAADLLKEEEYRLTAAIDAVHPNDHTEYVNCGTEVTWNEIVMLRAGYKSLFETESEQGLTFGAGINYRLAGSMVVKVDYAYEDFGRLKEIHYITVGVKF
ncbi:MAG: PorV/PorQ family protein [Melioribacteraceae bacterium]|nr:PorV/PorQ family protein [Melioribacteraceae bacterium]